MRVAFMAFILIFLATTSGYADTINSSPTTANPSPVRRNMIKRKKRAKHVWTLSAFEASALYVTQKSNQTSYSAMGAWTPAFWFNERFALRANLGLSALSTKAQDGTISRFGVVDYELLARYLVFSDWDLEAGGGVQTWAENQGTHGVLTAGGGYEPKRSFMQVIDRIFFEYSHRDSTPNSNEFRIGLGLLF